MTAAAGATMHDVIIVGAGTAGSVLAERLTASGRLRVLLLAAGAFGSPHLLLHSGIGPAAALAEAGIAPLRDAPEVGANLQDHPLVAAIFRGRGHDTMKNAESPLSLLRYLLVKRGMLASNGVEAFAFTHVHAAPPAAPDLELIVVPFEWRNQGLEPPSLHAFGIAPAVVTPRSRGRLSLRGPDPLTPPRIDLGLLSDADGSDAAVLLAGLRLARRIAAPPPLADAMATEHAPGAALTDDTSVMPTVPAGHPNAVVARLAERAAGWIEPGLAS